jgi:hypothetical protein
MRKNHCLVWLRSIRGPTPQIWAPDFIDVYRTQFEPLLLAIYELTDDERHEPLDRLARKYPPIPDTN